MMLKKVKNMGKIVILHWYSYYYQINSIHFNFSSYIEKKGKIKINLMLMC